MFVMLSLHIPSVHERQVEATKKRKARLAERLERIFTKHNSNNNNNNNSSSINNGNKSVSSPTTTTTNTVATIHSLDLEELEKEQQGRPDQDHRITKISTYLKFEKGFIGTAADTFKSVKNTTDIVTAISNSNINSSTVLKSTNLKQKENIENNNSNNILEGNFKFSNNSKKLLKSKPSFLIAELNNFRKPSTVQAPVATILNDLSPVPGVVKVKNKSVISSMSPMTPKGLPNETPDIKAMRYYRLWIYTCNAVLLMAVIIFCGVAGKVLVADYRRLLIADLSLGQPNFIYAYLALLMQSGFLQFIGCLGALRLSEKLLNAYWLLLLLLLIGDAVLGIFWMFKFDKIMETFEPILRNRLSTEYGNSNDFSELWDRLQSDERCCGVIGSQDFSNRTYPSSCCSSGDITEQISVSRRPLASAVVFRNEELSSQQKNNLSDIADTTWSHVVSETRESKSIVSSTCKAVYPQGCRDPLATWLRNTADILFVLGYCVIAFLKLCFLGILRYEIREMIQKIKLLQNEMQTAILEPEVDQQQLTQVTSTSINGGLHTEPKVGNRDRERSRISSGESERESLLVHENPPPRYLKNKHLYGCTESGSGHGGAGGGGVGGVGGVPGGAGGESDTNSNCALLVEDASVAVAAKSINGNNNYELTEFDTRGPTYRRINAPTVTKI